MGMHTELNIGVNLKADTPENIINILKFMIGDLGKLKSHEIPAHKLFLSRKWAIMFGPDSCYSDGYMDCSMIGDDDIDEYRFNIRCNLVNCDDEIELFLDFIRPYLATTGFLGYKRREKDKNPILIYSTSHRIEYKRIERMHSSRHKKCSDCRYRSCDMCRESSKTHCVCPCATCVDENGKMSNYSYKLQDWA